MPERVSTSRPYLDVGGDDGQGDTEPSVILRIIISHCTDLRKRSLLALPEPIIEVRLVSSSTLRDGVFDLGSPIGITAKSESIGKTLNPRWTTLGQSGIHLGLVLKPFHSPAPDYDVVITVYDNFRTRLGVVAVSLKDFPVESNLTGNSRTMPATMELPLMKAHPRDRVSGSITFGLSYDVNMSSVLQRGVPSTSSVSSSRAVAGAGSSTTATDGGAIVAGRDRPRPAAMRSASASPARGASSESTRSTTSLNTGVAGGSGGSNHLRLPDRGSAATVSLPEGFERRQDNQGRVFYMNHNSRTTTWVFPEGNNAEDGGGNADRHHPSMDTIRRREEAMNRLSRNPTLDSFGDHTKIPLPLGWVLRRLPSGRQYFIDHNTRTTTWDDPRAPPEPAATATRSTTPPPPMSPVVVPRHSRAREEAEAKPDELGSLPDGWEERVNDAGRVFYINHKEKATTFVDPRSGKRSKKVAKKESIKYSLAFDRKLKTFQASLRRSPGKVDLLVRRADVFQSSFDAIMSLPPEELKRTPYVVFIGEQGLDYGGVRREWFYLLSHSMFDPYYGLFEYSSNDIYTLQVNRHSDIHPEHLVYFEFIGRVMGMAVINGHLIDAFFIRPFYKLLLGNSSVTVEDMAAVDMEYYNNLNYVLENDPEDLEMTFEIDETWLGEVNTVELKPGGSDIKVTNDNKQEYVELVCKHRFIFGTKEQMESLKKGFYAIVPLDKLRIFDEHELELLIGGIADIDVTDWRKHTKYDGYAPGHQTVIWFWEAVRSFSAEHKARLLQFVTGTSRVPMNGFAHLHGSDGPMKFTIKRWGPGTMLGAESLAEAEYLEKLPRAHTCFNRVDLPPYTSYQMTREKLLMAIDLSGGFDGVD